MANILEGYLNGKDLKIGIVVARFNEFITSKLLSGAIDTLRRHETNEDDIDIFKMAFQVLNICLHQLGFARSTNTCDNLDVGSTVQLNDPVEIFCSCDCFHIVTHFQKLKKIHFLKLL